VNDIIEETAYAAAVREREEALDEITAEKAAHEMRMRHWNAVLTRTEQTIRAAEHNLCAAEDQVIGSRILTIEWDYRTLVDGRWTKVYRRTPDVRQCFQSAILCMQTGSDWLVNRYLGVKRYEGWDSQRHDGEYGMGPTHGAIWFRIGLNPPREIPSEADRLSCIRYLRAVEKDPDTMLGDRS
jgi:hypothetical protein